MTEHRCSVDWLLDPAGPLDPAWVARVRAEWDGAPTLVGKAREHARGGVYPPCRACGTTEVRREAGGRCSGCRGCWRRHGVDRYVTAPAEASA